MRRLLPLILAAGLLPVSFAIAAQAESTPDLTEADEESALMDEFALLQEEEIVLSAAKHKQKIGFSPSAVIVITRREIEESGAATLMELLRRYPAIHIYDFDPLHPNAEIRGSKRLLMIIDGRDVNLEIFEAPFFAAIPLGLLHIERIEVVLGPNSALYGANAVAAVINITTRQPGPGLHADLSLAAGEHGTTIFGAQVDGGTDDWAAQVTFGADQASSWMKRRLQSRNMKYATATFRLNLPDGSLSANAALLTGSGRLFGTLGYLNLAEFMMPHVKLAFELGDFKALLYWYAIRTDVDLGLDLRHPSSGLLLATLPMYKLAGDTFHLETQYKTELFENNLLIAGADARFATYRCDNFTDTNITETRIGVFLHDEHRFTDQVLLTVGARFDWNSKTEPAVSPRITLVYNPVGEHYLRLSGAYAFRKPTFLETSVNLRVKAEPAFPEIQTLFEEKGISNPGMENEVLTALELGYRGTLLDKSLRLGADVYFGINRSLTAFANDVRFGPLGQIDLEGSQLGYTNEGKDTDIVGVNLSIEGEPVDALTLFLRGEYRYMWFIAENVHVDTHPRLLAAAGGTLRLPFGLRAHLAAVYVEGRTMWIRDPVSVLGPSIDVKIPTRTYLLASLTYRLSLGRSTLDLGLTIFNAFGARFREAQGTPAPGGSNYGGEILAPRAMLTARLLY
jgi:iron complex outermembrane receptor protein